jgi:hypothetical protein
MGCAPGNRVHARVSGVSIGGVRWRLGQHCLYTPGCGAPKLGTVLNMFHGTDDRMDEFVIFQVENKPITTYMGHYCLFSNHPPSTIMVLWSQITWKCMIFKVKGGSKDMALPIMSCTSTERMEFP